jgi:hypothetical protein
MSVYACTLGNLLAVDGSRCSLGPGSGTDGTYNTFIGAAAGTSAGSSTANVVAIGAMSNVTTSTTNAVAIGYNATVGAVSNTVALGASSFSNTADTFVIGSPTNPLIPITYYSPFTNFRTIYIYTGSKNFVTDVLGSGPVINGVMIFNISGASIVTLPTSAQCLANLHDYVTGSYVFGYLNNTNTGSSALTIVHPAGTGYYPTSLTSLPAGQGFRFIIRYNGSGVDYIM